MIFFLVAALISLTTMTRMVEEQRTQIGTMKALGYSKIHIASKYLSYAFLATAGGSIVGILIGEKILPFIIIKGYGMMYHNVDKTLQIHYELKYALTASVAALICTVGATVFSCYRALAETPASLMRPPAPKEGRRILLERMPFLWKHLNFTWKSSLRNLFRYKKRLFMTVFGIAGSMALMLVGYGIRDSISDIVNLHGWSQGSFSGMSWSNIRVAAVVVGLAVLFTFFLSKPISAYQLGEAYAQSMGVNIKTFRVILILLSSILSACVTAFAGPISFVGIAVPFLARKAFGTSKPIVVIPGTFFMGAVFCMICDLIARMALAPVELNISTVTSILGAPIVIYMMIPKGGRK